MKRCLLLLMVLLLGQPALGQPTLEEAQLMVQFTEFLAGERFAPNEKEIVVAEMQQDYLNDRASYAQSIQDCAEVYQTLTQIQEPLQLGLVRQGLLGEYYSHMKAGHQSPTMELIFRKVQPLAWDGNRKMLLSTADLHGLLEYLSFQQQTQGGTPLSPSDRELLKQQFVSGFSQLSDEEMGFVCSGKMIWQTVAANWQRANQQQQANWSQQYSQSASPSSSGGGQMSPEAYRRMSQMMLQNHATNMNIIENIGGTGNYWSVGPEW